MRAPNSSRSQAAAPIREASAVAQPCAEARREAALLAGLSPTTGRSSWQRTPPAPHGLVEQNLKAVPDQCGQATTGDGRELGELEPGSYDRVLLDAPCTGLGALRRRPESRWRRSTADLPELTALQRDLLGSALRAVRPGGVVGYITCSPHVAETTLVVSDAIRDAAKEGIDVETLDAPEFLDHVAKKPLEGLSGPYAQLWPHVHGTDAMFLALIRRTA